MSRWWLEAFCLKYRWLWIGLAVLAVDFGAFRLWTSWRRWHSQDAAILSAARRYHLDPALVKAVVWRESRFNPRARGMAGEVGLMQVREAAAREWAAAEGRRFSRMDDLFDPFLNTMAGSWYLRKLIRRYPATDSPVAYALADYNAGRKNVLRWLHGASVTNSQEFLDQIDFPSTRRYVDAVLSKYAAFRKVSSNKPELASRE